MELPSFFYMQALCERIDYLTSLISDLDEYQFLKKAGCIFFDGYILYDPVTTAQFELDRYFLKNTGKIDWERMVAIVSQYTCILAKLSSLNASTHCIDEFKQLPAIRDAFYRQMIRERVYNGLLLYWRNMNGRWKIRFTSFEPPWGYYDVYRLNSDRPSEVGRGRLERMHLFLTEHDMQTDSRSLMFCEDLFDDLRKELGYLG